MIMEIIATTVTIASLGVAFVNYIVMTKFRDDNTALKQQLADLQQNTDNVLDITELVNQVAFNQRRPSFAIFDDDDEETTPRVYH